MANKTDIAGTAAGRIVGRRRKLNSNPVDHRAGLTSHCRELGLMKNKSLVFRRIEKGRRYVTSAGTDVLACQYSSFSSFRPLFRLWALQLASLDPLIQFCISMRATCYRRSTLRRNPDCHIGSRFLDLPSNVALLQVPCQHDN